MVTRVAIAALVVGAAAVAATLWWHREPDCLAASRSAPVSVAISVCRREYDRTRDPDTAAVLAGRLLDARDIAGAAAIAERMSAAGNRSHALNLRGMIAQLQGRSDEAQTLLEQARALHLAESRPGWVARDDQALAGVHTDHERFAEALTALVECIDTARSAHDAMIESFCHLAAGRVLSTVGYFELALRELDAAQGLASSRRNLAHIETERGNLAQDLARRPEHRGRNAEAIQAFEHVLGYAEPAQQAELVLTAEENLAFSLAEAGRLDDADRHLAAARQLDVGHDKDAELRALEARIAYRRGNPTLAWSINQQIYDATRDHDDRLNVAVLQTRIALAGGDLAGAERWARRGVDDAEQLRLAQSALELRPWVLASHREPFELLFLALARAGKPNEALLAFAQWQGRTLHDALAQPIPEAAADLRGVAQKLAPLGSWLAARSTAPSTRFDPAAARAALTTIDLFALAVADGELWTIAARRGAVKLRARGALTSLEDRLDRFRSHPTTTAALADELGALLLDNELASPSREALRVVLDEPLAALPVAALRYRGQPLIAIRPVLRVLQLPEASCAPAALAGPATVLGDSRDDLPAARREASAVAALLGTTSALGAAATSQALFAARRDGLLHVAVHGELDAGGGALVLRDRSVSALEIAARKLGPSLVVLSSCVAAASRDGELAGALATGFLAAGSAHVVASLRQVSDDGTGELMTRFYRAGGVRDPVGALAAAQAELAGTPNTSWADFAVFGNDSCPSHPE